MWIILILAILAIAGFTMWVMITNAKLYRQVVILVTGAVKTGKTLMSLSLAIHNYKRSLMWWKIKKIFKKDIEKPLFYSNIPIKGIETVRLTKEELERKKRFNYKSTIYIDELSLLVDSQNCKNKKLNQSLLEFFKLIAHETKGGKLFTNTQAFDDAHYSVKRVCSEVIYITKTIKWLPLIVIQEYEINRVINGEIDRKGEITKGRYINLKSTWKKYDRYCYSAMTDELPANRKTHNHNKKELKVKQPLMYKDGEQNEKNKH